MIGDSAVVLDIEADGLLPTVKQIWVVCLRNIETQQVDALRHKHELVEYLMEYKPAKIIMHNGIGYDLPALFKVWDIDYTVGQQDTIMGEPTEFIDTMHLSQFLYPDRLNGHRLEAFGELLGYPKTHFNDFTKYTKEMEDYCIQDTLVTQETYKYLMEEVNRRRSK
jgi:hypothetical protein